MDLFKDTNKVKIGIIGSNVYQPPFDEAFARFGFERVYLNQCLDKAKADDDLLKIAFSHDYVRIARGFLAKNDCPRTNDKLRKERLIERIKNGKFSGIIINTLKFCDFYMFDYIFLKEKLGSDFPILNIEHDLMSKDKGQIMTRLEAFFEGIGKRAGRVAPTFLCPPSRSGGKSARPGKHGKYFVGIDSGSHATKLVCVDKDLNVLAGDIVPTGTSVNETAKATLEQLFKKTGINHKDVGIVVATGYGRNNVGLADESVTEITCHAIGAHHAVRRGGTIIDIGGQDSKAIRIDDSGNVLKFAMNDKCAAGTGRFLEVMAQKLQISIDEFARLAAKADKSVTVSSMCSVFAESEVISLIAAGKSAEEIALGIHQAIASRTASLVKRIEGAAPYYMSGGVAKNHALVKELADCLGGEITVIKNPQLVGALGAAIYAARGL